MKSIKLFLLLFVVTSVTVLLSSCEKKQEPVTTSQPLFSLSVNDSIPKFDANYAYNQVKEQVDFGPRNPGSAGHEKALKYIKNELQKYADKVKLQAFSYTGYNNEKLVLTNIIGKFNPGAKNRIILCAHWDTRPRAEKAADPATRNKPILGANDGGSGVGVLLEIARVLKTRKVNYGIDLVFFDGEDYGKEDDLDNFCLGSKYYAANYNDSDFPAFGILLDLVGDKEAVFKEEGNSINFASDVVNTIWGIATKINANMFTPEQGESIYDDHIPLNQAGLRTVDVIDMDLVGANTPNPRRNYWHTHKDNMTNIGKNALQQVGNVMLNLIYTLKFNN